MECRGNIRGKKLWKNAVNVKWNTNFEKNYQKLYGKCGKAYLMNTTKNSYLSPHLVFY